MNHSHQNQEAPIIDLAQPEHGIQAALFIFNGIKPGKDHLSRVAGCFECSSVPKSTFISEEGCQVSFVLPSLTLLSILSIGPGNACFCHIWRAWNI
jgi:hypothetical protein